MSPGPIRAWSVTTTRISRYIESRDSVFIVRRVDKIMHTRSYICIFWHISPESKPILSVPAYTQRNFDHPRFKKELIQRRRQPAIKSNVWHAYFWKAIETRDRIKYYKWNPPLTMRHQRLCSRQEVYARVPSVSVYQILEYDFLWYMSV